MESVVSVNISEKKGVVKHTVNSIFVNDAGVKDDAHANMGYRQISLLDRESIEKFEQDAGRDVEAGEFAENITTEGHQLWTYKPLDRLIIGKTELEVTQIGKTCHGSSCAIFQELGSCVMPKEGIFCRVIKEGEIKANDKITYLPRTFKIAVITLSDRASKGIYADKSGPAVAKQLTSFFNKEKWNIVIENHLIPDSESQLSQLLNKTIDEKVDFVFTTGGTGIGPKDITPDVVKPLLEKEIPGLMDMIRLKYGSEKPNALISRSIAGITKQTQLYTLPGSVKAVTEYLEEITKSLIHITYMLHQIEKH